MPERNETHVFYKAIADFSSLSKAAQKAKKDIRDLRKEEQKLNAGSANETKNLGLAQKRAAKDYDGSAKSLGGLNDGLKENAGSAIAAAAATKRHGDAVKAQNVDVEKSKSALSGVQAALKNASNQMKSLNTDTDKASRSVRNATREFRGLEKAVDQASDGMDRFGKWATYLRNWRPRLIPPFIALVPIIGGLLGLINPLVAALGAVGTAAFGFASSLGSLAGAAIAVVPGLTAILSLVTALKVAFGGVGNVFKQYSALKNATTRAGGSGGAATRQAELSQTEQIERANERYARSIQDVQFAQEDLTKAREAYIDKLRELRDALKEASDEEGRARDQARFGQEYYAEILADPNVSEEDKTAAKEYADYLQDQYEEAKKKRKETEKELKETESTGVENDRAVIQARRGVTDALWAQRDAELAVTNAQNGTSSGGVAAGAAALNAYNDALAKLSPSARKFVDTILAMEEAWEDAKRQVQESFFSQIVDDLDKINGMLPTITTLLSDAAEAAGGVASSFIQLVTSDDTKADLGLVSDTNVSLIENVGEGLVAIADALLDISVAAGPFAESLGEGFREGMENFRELVSTAREDGSLADWLETVRERLTDWWTVVKNIGTTIFNYGAATSEFGDWLTDGLINLTEGWVGASEAAREEGSGFKDYLEDIKPLLSAIGELFGAFFGWLADVAKDEDNIDKATGIITQFQEELGPAISRILDLFADSEVSSSLIDAIVSILETLGDFLERGGLEGFEAFFDTAQGFFDALNEVVNAVPESWLSTLAVTMGVLSSLTFLGLDRLLLGLGTVLASKAVRAGLAGLSKLGRIGGGSGTGPGGGILGSVGRGLRSPVGKAGVIGTAAAVVGSVGYGLAADQIQDGQGGLRDQSANFVRGGAFSGIGAANFLLDSDYRDQVMEFTDTITGMLVDWASGLGQQIASAAGSLWEKIQGIPAWLGEQWEKFKDWLYNLPQLIGTTAGDIFINLVSFAMWLEEKWQAAHEWLMDLPNKIGVAVGNLWALLQPIGEWFSEKWEEAKAWLAGLPARVAQAVVNLWGLLKSLPGWLEDQWGAAKQWFRNLPKSIADLGVNIWKNVGNISGWLEDQWTKMKSWIRGIPKQIKDTFGNLGDWFFGGIEEAFRERLGLNRGGSVPKGTTGRYPKSSPSRYSRNQLANTGGTIRRSVGGGVPGMGVTDTVPTMLTPGEFVMRRAAVNKLGLNNLSRLNTGTISFGDLLFGSSAARNVQHLNSGGMVREPMPSRGVSAGPSNYFTMENVNIIRPPNEPAEESLIAAGQELAFMNGWSS